MQCLLFLLNALACEGVHPQQTVEGGDDSAFIELDEARTGLLGVRGVVAPRLKRSSEERVVSLSCLDIPYLSGRGSECCVGVCECGGVGSYLETVVSRSRDDLASIELKAVDRAGVVLQVGNMSSSLVVIHLDGMVGATRNDLLAIALDAGHGVSVAVKRMGACSCGDIPYPYGTVRFSGHQVLVAHRLEACH